MLRTIDENATNQSVIVRIVDAIDGSPEQAVTSATSGLALYYWRAGVAAPTAITISDLSLHTDAHSDGGILHGDDGYYRVDVPDAAFANGAPGVLIAGSATGMVIQGAYCEIRDADGEWNNIADALLERGLSNVEDTAGVYTLASALLKVLKSSVVSGNLQWYKTNGTTAFASQQITTSASANPITALGTPST